jgi:malate dehydrogenase
LVERTRKGGAEIVNLLKSGSAYYAPGASVAKMVESVIKDEKRLIAASAYLRGEYGFQNVFLGVPAIVGRRGIERILEVELTPEERNALAASAKAVEAGVRELETIYAPGRQASASG